MELTVLILRNHSNIRPAGERPERGSRQLQNQEDYPAEKVDERVLWQARPQPRCGPLHLRWHQTAAPGRSRRARNGGWRFH